MNSCNHVLLQKNQSYIILSKNALIVLLVDMVFYSKLNNYAIFVHVSIHALCMCVRAYTCFNVCCVCSMCSKKLTYLYHMRNGISCFHTVPYSKEITDSSENPNITHACTAKL